MHEFADAFMLVAFDQETKQSFILGTYSDLDEATRIMSKLEQVLPNKYALAVNLLIRKNIDADDSNEN